MSDQHNPSQEGLDALKKEYEFKNQIKAFCEFAIEAVNDGHHIGFDDVSEFLQFCLEASEDAREEV